MEFHDLSLTLPLLYQTSMYHGDVHNRCFVLDYQKKNTKVLLHLPRAKPICARAHISWCCACTYANLYAHARNLRVHVQNSMHTCTWNLNAIYHTENPSQNSKNCIFNWMTLTYDLDLRTCPRYYQGQSLYQISWPYAKRFSRESANWQTHTHTHTQTAPFL